MDPYQVFHRYGRRYVVDYCHLRNDLRVFRPDHTMSAEPQDATFLPPELDAAAAVERAIIQAPWRREFLVVAHMTPEEAARRLEPTLATRDPRAT